MWSLGENDNTTLADFQQEDSIANEPPGSPAMLDDDYYFAGVYPDPIGVVAEDELTQDPRGSRTNQLRRPVQGLERAFANETRTGDLGGRRLERRQAVQQQRLRGGVPGRRLRARPTNGRRIRRPRTVVLCPGVEPVVECLHHYASMQGWNAVIPLNALVAPSARAHLLIS
jgi:hypothetical protein